MVYISRLGALSLLVTAFMFPALARADVVWTAHTDLGTKLWQSVAMSADGAKIIAAAQTATLQSGGSTEIGPEYLYLSTNGGSSWAAITSASSRVWSLVTSSANGTQLAAVANNGGTGHVVTSENGGATWTDRHTSGSRDWRALAYSRDGSTLVGAAFNDTLYISNNSGATWTAANTGAHLWTSVAVSSNGQIIAATVENGPIYISRDGGIVWETTGGARNWRSVTMSADGVHMAATVFGSLQGFIYLSDDSGATWNAAPTPANISGWQRIASSANGETLVATDYYTDRVYASTDGGALWYELAGVTIPRNGTHLALTDAGDIVVTLGVNTTSNWADRTIYTGVLTPFTPPTPLLSAINVQDIIYTQARVTWNTDIPASSRVEYGTTDSYGNEENSAALVANHSVYINNLLCGTMYHYRVSSTLNGVTAQSNDATFTTQTCEPAIPVTNIQARNITTRTAAIIWKTPIDADSAVRYGLTDSYDDWAWDDTLVKNHRIRLTNLSCGTTYHYQVVSNTDVAQGTGPDMTFETLPCPAPTISEVVATSTTKQATTIRWKTAVAADSTVEYGTTDTYGLSVQKENLARNHSVRLTGLTCGTTYHYRVSSLTADNVRETSDDATITTLACSNKPVLIP